MTGKCQLCLKEKELQRKCHIIPKFFFKQLNDNGEIGGHTFSNDKWSKKQDHFYQQYIFCRECENDIFNKKGEHLVSRQYTTDTAPIYNDDDPPMHLAISVCFRAALVWQALYPKDELTPAIRCWRRWLLNPIQQPLLHRVGAITYDRDHEKLESWQKDMRKVLCYEVIQYKSFQLIWINVPGMVMFGVLANLDTTASLDFFDKDDELAKMVWEVSTDYRNRLLNSLPENPPPYFKWGRN